MEPLVVVGSKAQAFLVSYKTLATFFTPTPGEAAFGRIATPMTRGEVAIRLQKRWALNGCRARASDSSTKDCMQQQGCLWRSARAAQNNWSRTTARRRR